MHTVLITSQEADRQVRLDALRLIGSGRIPLMVFGINSRGERVVVRVVERDYDERYDLISANTIVLADLGSGDREAKLRWLSATVLDTGATTWSADDDYPAAWTHFLAQQFDVVRSLQVTRAAL